MRKIVLISIALAFPAHAFAVSDARSVVEDARDGRLERYALLESAIQLSELISDAQREVILTRFAEIATSRGENLSAKTSDLAKVKRFIRQLHLRVLSGPFDAESCHIEDSFHSGRHNCVISLILVLEFCRRERISANAMQSGHHVWLRVHGDDLEDVETTRLRVSDEMRSGAVSISDVQLLARLLYNQARQHHQSGNFEEAAKRLEWCLLIDSSFEPAERNLRIVLGNWMSAAEFENQFAEAVAVSRRAIVRFPDNQDFRQNSVLLNDKWAKWRKLDASSGTPPQQLRDQK